MEFRHIFTKKEDCRLWSTVYPGAKADTFKQLFDLWFDTEYLFDFFTKNQHLLSFWGNISVDEAIDKVLDEAQHFNDELWAIETSYKGYENVSLRDIFKPLHENIYSSYFKNEAQRKGKPDFEKPMLRLYGIELDDGCMVITGGAIKLTREMSDEEKQKLKRVQMYLQQENITSKECLINN